MFQSPKSGKFVSDSSRAGKYDPSIGKWVFQSPRSEKFVSNLVENTLTITVLKCFNPLDRGNLYQMKNSCESDQPRKCFNPLDRGNLYQIQGFEPVISKVKDSLKFQSPRSGKFVSNDFDWDMECKGVYQFQSPRSGKFVLDAKTNGLIFRQDNCFNPLDRGNLYLIQVLN